MSLKVSLLVMKIILWESSLWLYRLLKSRLFIYFDILWFLKPRKVSCPCVSICVFAGYWAHLLTWEPNLWVERFLGHEKETYLFLFSKFSCLRFLLVFFDFFPYITQVFFFKLLVTVLYKGMWYLGWVDLLPLENWDFWQFPKILFFTVKGAIFPINGGLIKKSSLQQNMFCSNAFCQQDSCLDL